MKSSIIILRRRILRCCLPRNHHPHNQQYHQQQPFSSFSMTTKTTAASSRSSSSSSSSSQSYYDKYLSKISKLRQPSAIRKLQPLVSLPNMISLGGGLPNPNLFPIQGLSFSLSSPTKKNVELTEKELNLALQYSPTNGIPALRDQLIQLQKREHGGERGWDEDGNDNDNTMDLTITVGSQDGFCKAIEMLIDPGEGSDNIFLESPTYSGALSFLHPFGARLVPILTDEHGMIPSKLEEAIETTSSQQVSVGSSSSSTSGSSSFLVDQQQSLSRPKGVIYIIPTAQNPSGVTLSQERRLEIYNLATKYDLIILEDDPYYFLHPNRNLYDSFLSLDIKNNNDNNNGGDVRRVIRFDSFSKLISSGLRLGLVSGPKELIGKLNLHIQATNLHNSGLSQVVLSKIMDEWGEMGFNNHCQQVSEFYCQRRDVMVEACKRHLLTSSSALEGGEEDLVEFNIPEAGLVLWMKLNNINDSKLLIEEKASKANILLVPGQSFLPISSSHCNDHPMISPYVRASFSTATDDEIDTAMERLASLLKSERG